jgi:hypothetical protein
MRRTQTIEQTGKIWKLQMILGYLTFLIAFAGGLSSQHIAESYSLDPSGVMFSAFAVGFLSIFWLASVKVLTWWFHG